MAIKALIEFALLVLPSLDWISDVFVVVFNYHLISYDVPIFFAGFVLVGIAAIVRCVCEDISRVGFKDANIADKWWCLRIACMPVGVLIACERIIKLALQPLEPIFSLAWYMEKGKCACVARDKVFCLTSHEASFYADQHWALRYCMMLTSLSNGSRWHALVLWPWRMKKFPDTNRRSYHVIVRLALFEESLENVGGILMSSYLLHISVERDQNYWLAIASLVVAGIDALYESSTYIIRLGAFDWLDDQE